MALFAIGFAQTADSKWNIGLHMTQTEYRGDLGNGFFDFDDFDPGVMLNVGYYLSPTFDLNARFGYAEVDYTDENGTYGVGNGGYADLLNSPRSWGFDGNLWNASLNLKLKFNNGWFFSEDAIVGPFINGGVGMTYMDVDHQRIYGQSKEYSNLALNYGGGFNIRLGERLNMVLEANVINPTTDVYDGVDVSSAPGWEGADKSDDRFLQYSVGFTYNLGAKQDSDGDGVADRKDKCPNTPIGVAVDEDGCPIDTDGDGVPDYMDKCPKEPGTINGCPDIDGDGIIDSEDKCPKVAGLKELQGCPDSDDDKDGVLNLQDKCPNTPVGVEVDKDGCPIDTDGDGIADYLDKCPNEAGPAKTQGCPVQDQLNEFAKQIYFNFDKATLKTESFIVLDKVVELIKPHSDQDFKIIVKGHTDSKGNDAYNQKLSERRAASVRDYLVKKGIDASKIRSIGYGETQPIATNDTAEGRAQNRRTEIVVE